MAKLGETKAAKLESRGLQTAVAKGRDTLRAVLREVALRDPWVFLTDVLNHPSVECDGGKCCDKKRGFYEPLHRPWVEWAANSSVRRKGLLAPRGHFKSSVISFGKSCHAILRNPDIRILLLSALERNALKFCGQVKRAFQHNDRMRWLFPEYCVDIGRQFGNTEEFTSPARQDHSLAAPTFTASYIDAALASQHYDLIIFDDPIEAKHVATEEQAQKALDSYQKAIPLLDPDGEIVCVATRWAYFDLYGSLLPENLGGTAKNSPYSWIVRSALERDGKPDFDNGDPIFPTRFPRSTLIELLDEARLNPAKGVSFWWNQYMNYCRAPEQQPFYDEWFTEITMDMVPPLFGKMLSVDTAVKDGAHQTGGDYTVILVGGWDVEGRLYLIPDCVFSNVLKSKAFCESLAALSQKHLAPTVIKQKVSEDALIAHIEDAFGSARTPLDLRTVALTHMGRKRQRIVDALQSPMQRKEIFWVKKPGAGSNTWESHPLLQQAKRELLNLGQYPTDDVADCLANFFHPDIKVRKQNLVGQTAWRVPNAPPVQLGNQMNQQWSVRNSLGSGWSGRSQ